MHPSPSDNDLTNLFCLSRNVCVLATRAHHLRAQSAVIARLENPVLMAQALARKAQSYPSLDLLPV